MRLFFAQSALITRILRTRDWTDLHELEDDQDQIVIFDREQIFIDND